MARSICASTCCNALADAFNAAVSEGVSAGDRMRSTPPAPRMHGRLRQTSAIPYCPVSSVETGSTALSLRKIASHIRTIAVATPEGCVALALDNSVAGVAHLRGDLALVEFLPRRTEFAQRQPSDTNGRERCYLAVAMLAQNKPVDGPGRDLQALGERLFETARVEQCFPCR